MILAGLAVALTVAVSPSIVMTAPATVDITITVSGDREVSNGRQMCLYFKDGGATDADAWTTSCWPYQGYTQTKTRIRSIPEGEHLVWATLDGPDGTRQSSAKVTMKVLGE